MDVDPTDLGMAREVARISNPPFRPGHVEGHTARRLIPGDDFAYSDPFLLMAEDRMPRNAFALHPHRGIETVTFVLDGAVEHSDSAGHRGVIKTGDAQWMTAGRGVTHEENALPGTMAHTLQLWVNLPASEKMSEPRYQDLRRETLPLWKSQGVQARVLSGRVGGAAAPTLNHVPVTAADIDFAPNARFEQQLEPDFNGFVLVLAGEVLVGAMHRSVKGGELAWLTEGPADRRSSVELRSSSTPSRALLVAGKRLREPVAAGGPFVMNTQAEIDQAFADYREGRF